MIANHVVSQLIPDYRYLFAIGMMLLVSASGCAVMVPEAQTPLVDDLLYDAPRELNKAILPTYRIAPPDILSIDVAQQVVESSYPLHVGDTVMLTVMGTLPEEPIAGIYPVEAGGVIQLGFGYGKVEVVGMTVDEAKVAIEQHLRDESDLRDPQVSLGLRDVTGIQVISGEHLVGPDGTVTLGRYGSVPLVGLTLEEARYVLEDYLSQYFATPEASVSVYAFNSRHYYVVTQGAGLGDDLVRLPYTGNETVIDAISHVSGLSPVSSLKMWIARPGRNEVGGNQILPVDWVGITQRGEVETNYQLLPGDRLYIAQDRFAAFDQSIAKVTAPLERIFGFTLLGTATTSRLSGKVLNNRQNLGSFGGGGIY